MRPMSTETIGRVSLAVGSSEPAMFEPPPKGMSTAFAARATCTMRATSSSSPG